MASHDSLKGKRTRSGSPSKDKNSFIIVFDSKKDEKTTKTGAKKRKESNQLAFINSTSGQPVAGAREIIRTHVMSDYWRKKSLKKKQDQRPVLTEQDLTHINNAVTQPKRSPLLCQPLGGPDPFSRISIDMKPFMYTILERYVAEIVHEICPKTAQHESEALQCPRLIWLRMGLADAAVCRALLCVTAQHIDVTDGKGFSARRYALKRDAIHTIGERLSDIHAGVSDETITAVTLLAIDEGVSLNLVNWASHMSGLKKMVELRGGLSNLGDELRCLIHIADLHGCNGTAKLYFPWVREPTVQHIMANSISPSGSSMDLSWTAKLAGLDEHLVASFGIVRSLTAAMDQASQNGAELDPFIMEAAVTWIRSRLETSIIIEREPEQQHLHTSCCLGIYAYLTTIIDRPVDGLDQHDLVSGLKSSLPRVDMKNEQSPLILWSVFFGGLAAKNLGDRYWFVSLLRDILHSIFGPSNICGWESLKTVLKGLSWLGTRHDIPGRQMWEAIADGDGTFSRQV